MLLIKSSKFSIPRSFSMPVAWNIWWISPLRVIMMFTTLISKKVELIFLEFFGCWHLKARHWFLEHTLSLIKSFPENFNFVRSKDFCGRFLWFLWIFYFSFLSSNFKITLSVFLSQWHACRSSRVLLEKELYR